MSQLLNSEISLFRMSNIFQTIPSAKLGSNLCDGRTGERMSAFRHIKWELIESNKTEKKYLCPSGVESHWAWNYWRRKMLVTNIALYSDVNQILRNNLEHFKQFNR